MDHDNLAEISKIQSTSTDKWPPSSSTQPDQEADDHPAEFKTTVGSIDVLLKKLEEDDRILKELEELEKKDRLTNKKLSSSTATINNTPSQLQLQPQPQPPPTTSTIISSNKVKLSTIVTATATVTSTPSTASIASSSPVVTTVSKSTSTSTIERETQYVSPSPPSPPPTQRQPLPLTQTAGTNTISTKSVSTSTISNNTSSTISEKIAALNDHFNSPSSPLSRFGQLALASYGIGLTGASGSSGGGATGTSGVGGSNLSSSMPSLIDHQQALQLLTAQLQAKGSGSSISPQELDRLMEKLEHDNRILAELDQKVKRISSTSSGISSPVLSTSLPTLTGITHPALLQTLYPQLFPALLADRNILMRDNKRLMLQSASNSSSSPATLYYDDDIEQIQLLQALIKNQQQELAFDVEDIADYIEIPNRGRCRVYIARYSYDPFKQSPNENPESELHLAAGDFILVSGDMDEDGFFFGELLDGRRGLVPSNFIEKLIGEDLFEFQASVLYEGRDGDESTCSYPPEFYDALLDDLIAHSNFQHLIAPEDFHRMNDYIELCESSDIDEEDLSDPERAQANAAKDTVPPPKRLILERQLHKSILLGWLIPDCPRSYIDNYQIYVDGVLKVTVPSNERTRALVEGVDSSIPHRISVRAITPQGRASRDAACTIVVGKNVPFAPCSVKSTNITATSALISWLPSNSNFYHVVAVNSVEVKTVGPSTYKHLITGLSPNTMYRVSVRAKPGKLLCSEEKNPKKLEMLTTFVDFRTLPKSLPEPPVDVQIDSGPQDGTLLVTWLPVPLDQFGTSNGCPVTGYAVFSSHKKLAEIDSPTSDHALLDISQIESFHKKSITVRTKSGENLSQDSIPCHVPEELIKFTNHNHNQISNNNINNLRKTQNSPASMRGPGMVQNRGSPRMIQPSQSNQPGQQQIRQFHPQQQPRSQHPYQNQQHPTNRNQMNQQQPNQQIQGPHNQQQSSSINQPSIAITKDMHQNGKKPMGQPGNRLGGGPSPQPPQRNRQYTDHERSHFGQGRGAMGPSGPQSRVMGPNRPSSQQQQQQQQHQQQQQIGQRDIRYFVALYDYDPLTMSPNPDAANEELPFREGDIIKIYGDKDPDGFYRGELNDRVGFVPCNMVSEVQYDPETGAPLRMGSGLSVGGSGGPVGVGPKESDPWAHLPVKKMIALYDYDPQELSPNPDSEMELAFHAGDTIYVYGDLDEDGFYMGELNGNRGLVPSNFLTEALTDGTTRHASQNHPVNRGPTGDTRQSMSHQQQQQHHQQFQAHQTGHQQQPSINNQHHQQQPSTQSHQQQQLIQPHQQQQQGFQSHQNQTLLQHQPLQQQGQGYGQHQFQGQPQHQTITSNHHQQQQKLLVNSNNPTPIGHQQPQQQPGMRPQGNFTNVNQSIHNQQQQLGIQQRPNSLELRSNQPGIGQQSQQLINQQHQQQQLNQMGQQQQQQFQNQHQQQQFNQQQKMLQQQQHLHQNPNQMNQHLPQQSTNPISNLLNSGKQMLAEATTPRVGQPSSNFDSHGQSSMMTHHPQQQHQQHGQNQLNHLNQQGSNINNNNNNSRFNSGLNQQQHQQQQQHYPGQQQLNQQSTVNRQFGNTNTTGQGSMMGHMTGQQPGQNQQGPTLSGALGAVKSIFKI